MKPDNQNNPNGGKNGGRRSMMAIASIVLWALVITVFVNYMTASLQRANSTEIWYSEFLDMVEAGVVDTVEMTNTKFTIYLREGAEWPLAEDEETGGEAESTAAPAESEPPAESTAPTQEELRNAALNELLGLDPNESLPPLESLPEAEHTYYCAPINDPDLIPLLRSVE